MRSATIRPATLSRRLLAMGRLSNFGFTTEATMTITCYDCFGREFEPAIGVWYPWVYASPPRGSRSIECRRGDGQSFALDPSTVDPWWNVANVYWRDAI